MATNQPLINPLLIEAEDLTVENYVTQPLDSASGGEVIKVSGGDSGTASKIFRGDSGTYDVVVRYLNEGDSESTLEVSINDLTVDTWSVNDNVQTTEEFRERTIANVSLEAEDTIKIVSEKNGGEDAPLDFIELIPSQESSTSETLESRTIPLPRVALASASVDVESVATSTTQFSSSISRIEAEDMSLNNYQVHTFDSASGRQVARVGSSGSISTTFDGEEGTYDLKVRYLDEDDGESTLEVWINDQQVDTWLLDDVQTGQEFIERKVGGIQLQAGDKIEIRGERDNYEYARIDHIELVGVETVNIMPLGDSITEGISESENSSAQNQGGYRAPLWESIAQLNINPDFVGSLANGPQDFDRDHNGYGGQRINFLAGDDWSSTRTGIPIPGGNPGGLTASLSEEQPDIILLMAGTNNVTANQSVNKMANDLGNLINRITTLSPDTTLLVSSIPPIREDSSRFSDSAQLAQDFNAAIPGVVNTWSSQGRNVAYVDMTSLTEDDLSLPEVDNGLHPTEEGYEKIAQFWLDAINDNVNIRLEAVGTNGNDQIQGNDLNNRIEGGLGSDNLTGGDGQDRFVYNSAAEGLDTITDFSANDVLEINADGFGGGLEAGVLLNANPVDTGVFVSGNNPIALGSSANFLYNTSSGILSFDVDGVGASQAVTIATLSGAPNLEARQFDIV